MGYTILQGKKLYHCESWGYDSVRNCDVETCIDSQVMKLVYIWKLKAYSGRKWIETVVSGLQAATEKFLAVPDVP